MRAARDAYSLARSHTRDIPCIIITASALGEGTSYLFLTGIQDGERASRPEDFCVTASLVPAPGARMRGREEWNQFAGATERHDTPRRGRGVRMAGCRAEGIALPLFP